MPANPWRKRLKQCNRYSFSLIDVWSVCFRPGSIALVCAILGLITISLGAHAAAAQTMDCPAVRCITHYSGAMQGDLSNLSYSWANTNPCGIFLENYFAPGQPQNGVAYWAYGPGIGSPCTTLDGTVTVTISSGSYAVICTAPNGAAGADLYVAGKNGVNTCIPSEKVRIPPFKVNNFVSQQTYGFPTEPATPTANMSNLAKAGSAIVKDSLRSNLTLATNGSQFVNSILQSNLTQPTSNAGSQFVKDSLRGNLTAPQSKATLAPVNSTGGPVSPIGGNLAQDLEVVVGAVLVGGVTVYVVHFRRKEEPPVLDWRPETVRARYPDASPEELKMHFAREQELYDLRLKEWRKRHPNWAPPESGTDHGGGAK